MNGWQSIYVNPRLSFFFCGYLHFLCLPFCNDYGLRFFSFDATIHALFFLSFKSRANQLPRNRSKFIHHLLSFYIKYKFTNVNCMWFVWKISHLYLYLVKCSLKCKCNQANNGSNRESASAWSVSLNIGRGKHLSVERKEAIWNLFSFFQDEAERGRPRHKFIYKKVEKAL